MAGRDPGRAPVGLFSAVSSLYTVRLWRRMSECHQLWKTWPRASGPLGAWDSTYKRDQRLGSWGGIFSVTH